MEHQVIVRKGRVYNQQSQKASQTETKATEAAAREAGDGVSQFPSLPRISRNLREINTFIPLNTLNFQRQLPSHGACQTSTLVIIQLISLAAAKHGETGFDSAVCGWTRDDVEMHVWYLLGGSDT